MCESIPNNIERRHYPVKPFLKLEKTSIVNDTHKIYWTNCQNSQINILNSGYKQFQPFGASGFILSEKPY
jgi:S-adenosylmethionine/arginine decarboxylase-like enzyme